MLKLLLDIGLLAVPQSFQSLAVFCIAPHGFQREFACITVNEEELAPTVHEHRLRSHAEKKLHSMSGSSLVWSFKVHC